MTNHKRMNHKWVIVGLAAALIVVIVGVFFFSYANETLDAKAQQLGMQEKPYYVAPLPDYTVAGSSNPWVAAIVGVAATLLIFIAAIGAAKLLNKKKSKRNQP